MFKVCLENRVIRNQSGYACCLCNHETCSSTFDLVEYHINSNGHQQKLGAAPKNEAWESSMLEQISEPKRKELVENYVSFEKSIAGQFICNVCKCMANDLEKMFFHISRGSHKSMVKCRENFMSKISTSVGQKTVSSNKGCFTIRKNNAKCNLCKCYVQFQNMDQHVNGSRHLACVDANKNAQFSDCFVEIRYCDVCQTFLSDDSSLSYHSMIHILSELNSTEIIDIIKSTKPSKKVDAIVRCLLCNVVLPNSLDLNKHVNTNGHLNRLKILSSIKGPLLNSAVNKNVGFDAQTPSRIKSLLSGTIVEAAYCKVCHSNCKVTALENHRNSKKHLENFIKPGGKSVNNIQKLTGKCTICFACQVSFKSIDDLMGHYKSPDHKCRIGFFQMIFESPFLSFTKESNISCSLCNVSTHDYVTTREHINGKKHKNQLETIKTEGAAKPQELVNGINKISGALAEIHVSKITNLSASKMPVTMRENPGTSSRPQELSPANINDMLNNLMNMNPLDQKQRVSSTAKMSKSAQSSPLAPSKLSTFNRNVLNYGKTYINYCIEPSPYNIYTVDPYQIHCLKLGISLTHFSRNKWLCIPCEVELDTDNNLFYEHLQSLNHVKNVQEMMKDDEAFADYPNQYSDLRLAKNYMKQADDHIYCCACNAQVNNEDADITLHTEMSNHIGKARALAKTARQFINEFTAVWDRVWYYAQVFVCEICQKKCDFEIDFVIHLNESRHQGAVQRSLKKGVSLKYDVCPVCVTYWYGQVDAHKTHCESLFHRRFANNGDFAVSKMPLMTVDLLKNFDKRVASLIAESDKAALEKKSERELLKAVEDTVKPLYPGAKAYTFGSRLSNLGFPDSDIDVYLDCQSTYSAVADEAKIKEIVLGVKKFFEDKPDVWIIDEVLLATRVPILKLRHIKTSLKCDISFTNGLSVEKSTLVGNFNEAYPVCRAMILYLKKWFTTCKLAGSECINSFASSWLVIFYLQTQGILPCVYDLIRLQNQSKIVDGWECGFVKKIPVTPSNKSVKDHLRGFFSFYAKYDFKTNVICPFLGISRKKRDFAHPESLPAEFNLYKSRLKSNYMFLFRFDSPMCVEDPVDLSQNMTKAVKKLQLRSFIEYCSQSYQLINQGQSK